MNEASAYAERICVSWRGAVEAIIETGQLLIEAKSALPGQFEAMIENALPFGTSTAVRLMAIARNHNIVNPAHAQLLPPSWGTLYELSQLEDVDFQELLDDGTIRADLERPELEERIRVLRREHNNDRAQEGISGGLVTDLVAFAKAGYRVGTIYADPPWLYDNQGTRASTNNHYAGLTVAQLCNDIPVKALCAEDAHLHLWTTNGFLFQCQSIMEAWGFEFKSSFVWTKTEIGIGNYWRNSHEFLLTGVRGNAKRFNDHNLKSWIETKRGKHSSKPHQVRTFIERASPGPYLELFAREYTPGWCAWGHEVSRSLLSQGAKIIV